MLEGTAGILPKYRLGVAATSFAPLEPTLLWAAFWESL